MKMPTKIYLQTVDDYGGITEEITWCIDKINETDVEYIRTKTAKIRCFLFLGAFLVGWICSPFII